LSKRTTFFHPFILELCTMFRFLKEVASALVWGFSMALGWIAAFALVGAAVA
jgi:hypothetical protein